MVVDTITLSRVIYINIFLIVKTFEHFVVACKFGGFVSSWMSAIEEHAAFGGDEKYLTVRCWVVH